MNAAAGEHRELCCGSLQLAGPRNGEGQWSESVPFLIKRKKKKEQSILDTGEKKRLESFSLNKTLL